MATGCNPETAKYHDRDGISVCTYCGGMNPDVLMAHLEAGTTTLEPTDKNYKVYAIVPEPLVGQMRITGHSTPHPGRANDTLPSGWKIWDRGNQRVDGMDMKDGDAYCEDPRPATRTVKFYFEHLTRAQAERFIAIYNEKLPDGTRKMKLAYPGYFYRPPFFMRFAKDGE